MLNNAETRKILYARMNANEETKLSPFPYDRLSKIRMTINPNDAIITSNPEVIKEIPNVIGGLAINSTVNAVMNQLDNKLVIKDLDLMTLNPTQAINDLQKQIKLLRQNGRLTIHYIGNLPFLGEGEKLWQKILIILIESGFDEIHIIIPARGLVSKEMINQKLELFPGLKDVHIIRPYHWDTHLNTLCCQIHLVKGYTGPVTVYDDFNKLYQQPQKDWRGDLKFIAPCEQWPDFENFLISQCGSDDFYKQKYRKTKIDGGRTEQRMMIKQFDNNTVTEITNTGLKFGPADYIDRFWKPGQRRLVFKAQDTGGIYIKNMYVTDRPVSGKQICIWNEQDFPIEHLKNFMQTSWGAFYLMLTYPAPHLAFSGPQFRLICAFDFSRDWNEEDLNKLHGPRLTDIKNQILQRYKDIY